MDELYQKFAEAAERGEKVWTGDPLLTAIRHTVLDLERKAHATGWSGPDAPPRLLALEVNRRTCETAIRWPDSFNDLMRLLMQATDSNLSAVLDMFANVAEITRQAASGDDAALPSDMPESTMDKLRKLREEYGRGVDLLGSSRRGVDLLGSSRRGFQFFGYGVRYEGWMASFDPKDTVGTGAEIWKAAQQRKLHTRPERIESRMVTIVTRDGLSWLCMRLRGYPPFVTAVLPESDEPWVGDVPNRLSRMVRAAVNNPMPLTPARPVGFEE